ncbi:AMIN-like domain-containing (lipo)protein [Rhodococcus sp. GB-02]
MNVRRVITLLGAMSFLSLLAGCQTDDESDTAGGSSTQVVLDAATRTGTLQVGSRPLNAPSTEISMRPPLPNDTEIPSPNPPVDVSEIDVTDHEGFTRITYRFDGNGPVFWKTEYVSEAIRAGDSTVVDVGSRSILQVDLMGVQSASVHDSVSHEGASITRMDSAAVNNTILQSFVGTVDIRPTYTVSTSDSPSQLTIDIPAVDN